MSKPRLLMRAAQSEASSPSRDREGAVGPAMPAQGGKAVAQVLDSKRDHSEAVGPAMPAQGGKAVAQVLDSKRDHSEVGA